MLGRCWSVALAALALGGCWGEVTPIFPDAGGGDTDVPSPVLYPGGGVGGGPLDGHLNLYFIDEATGAGVAGTRVMVGDDPGTALFGETDSTGLVVFHDPELSGAVDVHAWASGHVLESALALAWTNATIPLRPEGLDGGGTATVAGAISGWEDLPEPSTTQYRIARIHFGETLAALLSFRGRDFTPKGVDSDELRPDGGAFSIEVPASRGAVFAVAGVVETYGTPETADDVASWSRLGVVGGLDPLPGETVTGIDISLDTPLSVEVKVLFETVPISFAQKDVYLGFDLGSKGTAWLEAVCTSYQFAFTAPYPAGDYADAGPLLVGAAEQVGGDEPDAGPFDDLPRSFVFARDFTSWLGYDVTPLALDQPLPPPSALDWQGGAFTCLTTMGRDLSQLVVSDAETGGTAWRVTVWGDLPDSPLPYPSLPVEWGAPAAPAGGVAIEAFVDTVAEGTSEMLFDEFSSIAETRVVAGATAE